MNQYLFLRRMRGPIFLLVFGITAILDEYTSVGYGMSWPLYIIAWGILQLAENAILAQNPPPPPGQIPGYPPPAGYTGYPGYAASGYPGYPAAAPPSAPPDSPSGSSTGSTSSTAIVPSGEDRR
jgi:hypothetical protein